MVPAGSDLRPRPLEIVSGLALGRDTRAEALPADAARDPRAALEDVLRRALRHSPCLVSFSGGRDSSAVLATAAAVARREGLALPVPITYRFAAAPDAAETAWQERVVAHLGLPDWERVPITTELDVLGPAAQDLLVRLGLLWPFNAAAHVPLLRRARGGMLLTGIGGDELLGASTRASALAVLGRGRRRPPSAREMRAVALALVPAAVRREVRLQRRPLRTPWAQPAVEATIARAWTDGQARDATAWNAHLRRYWRSRHRTVLAASLARLAADADARFVHPFLEPAVAASVARRFGWRGPADRSAAMAALFGDVLPRDVLTRASKARFDEAFVTDHSRAFIAGWDGTGVDEALVDPARLAAEWRSGRPNARSLLLLQSAWLTSR